MTTTISSLGLKMSTCDVYERVGTYGDNLVLKFSAKVKVTEDNSKMQGTSNVDYNSPRFFFWFDGLPSIDLRDVLRYAGREYDINYIRVRDDFGESYTRVNVSLKR